MAPTGVHEKQLDFNDIVMVVIYVSGHASVLMIICIVKMLCMYEDIGVVPSAHVLMLEEGLHALLVLPCCDYCYSDFDFNVLV